MMNKVQPSPRGFTLLELLIVIGIIATLAVLTATSVSRLSRDSRLAIGVNQVMSALGEARARALMENQPILVTFVVRRDAGAGVSRQVTDMVITKWTGQLLRVDGSATPNDPNDDVWNEPFEVHPDAVRRTLPPGIKVAGPRSDYNPPGTSDQDAIWITQPELTNNECGRAIGVLFSPDGTVATRFPNGIGVAQYETAYLDLDGATDSAGLPFQQTGSTSGGARFFIYDEEIDEPSINYVKTLAVFDDTAAREFFNTSNWSGQSSGAPTGLPLDCSTEPVGERRMRCEQSHFITQYAERINFNRFTGVAEVVKR